MKRQQTLMACLAFQNCSSPSFTEETTQQSSMTTEAPGDLVYLDHAFYGIWEYGDTFGGDPKMCDRNGEINTSDAYQHPGTGCVIKTAKCSTGRAVGRKKTLFSGLKVASVGVHRRKGFRA